MIPTTPILSRVKSNSLKAPVSPSPSKRSDPLNSLSVAAAAAASSLRHSFNVTNNNYNLNHTSNNSSGIPEKLKGSFKGRGRHATGLPKPPRSNGSAATGNENYYNNHGRFQRTLSLDGGSQSTQELNKVQEEQLQQMPQDNGGGGGGGTAVKNGGGKTKRMMFGGSKFSQNSLSFDVRDREVHPGNGAYLKKSHSAEHEDSACEEEDEDGVVLRKKQPMEFEEHSDDPDRMSRPEAHQSGILSTFISTSHRNSQLRSTLSKARHHLSFDKWRSSSNHNHSSPAAAANPQQQQAQSATPNSNHSQDCTSANHSTCSANQSSLSNSSSNTTPPTPNDSPGGRLSRWFSIRRGSSHHYDLNGSAGSSGRGGGGGAGGESGGALGGGRDVRDCGSGASSRLNSINNEVELAQQIQQQLHQSLSKVISQSNALQQLQQQSAQVTSNGLVRDKMPLVAEGAEVEEGYQTFGRGMSFRTTSTLKSVNPSQIITPMPPVPPAGLTQQQLKRRHIVAAIAHSEISYVATLSRLVNVSIQAEFNL